MLSVESVLLLKACYALQSVEHLKYYAGWADKIYGKVAPTAGDFQAIVYKEPLGKTWSHTEAHFLRMKKA